MITHITKNNRAEYVKLFAKATDALKENNSTIYPDDFSISSLEEYFQNLEELFALDPRFMRIPVDEEMFEIDLNTRQIVIPSSFKKSGLGVQGDDLAEVVYFKVDRFFDATDLNETFIMIQWEAPSGKKMVSPAYFQEVDSETDKLIFGWAVTKEMTTSPGILKFAVAFIDGEVKTEEGHALDIEKLTYRLGTLSNSINVNAGLSVGSQKVVQFENRLSDLKNRIKNTPILGGIIDGAAALAEILVYKGFGWDAETVYANIYEDLVDDPEADEVLNGLPLLAVSPNAGLISYEWYKEGVEDPIAQGPGAVRYFEVSYPESEKLNEAIYFVKEGEQNYRYFDEGKDIWEDLVERHLLFEKIGFIPVSAPGKYFAKITNKEGMKISTLNTFEDLNVCAIIPGPTEIAEVIISASSDIFDEANPVMLESEVAFSEDDEYANLHYQWYRDGAAIDGATQSALSANVVGDYGLSVINHWNGAVSAMVEAKNIVQIYPAAVIPEIISFTANSLLEGTDYALVGATLTVEFKPIEQEKARQYVRWQYSDNDNVDDDSDWEDIMENGEYVEGNTFIVPRAGDYRAVIYNYITDTNVQSITTDKIQAVNINAED